MDLNDLTKCVRRFETKSNPNGIGDLVTGPDGNDVAAILGIEDERIMIWRNGTLQARTYQRWDTGLQFLALNPAGDLMATASDCGRYFRVFKLHAKEEIK